MRIRNLLLACFVLSLARGVTPAVGQSFSEYPLPTAGSNVIALTVGPDGNVWFTEVTSAQIGRITPAGVITEFDIPMFFSSPAAIVSGPDGRLWFADGGSNSITSLDTSGTTFTGHTVPTLNSRPLGIVVGPDDNLWFTEVQGNKIGVVTTSGTFTEYDVPTSDSRPAGIAVGADGNLWFVEALGNKVGRITPTGTITEFAIPTADSYPTGIAAGPDGRLWFTEYFGNNIGAIDTAGTITEYPIPTAASYPEFGIVSAPDGKLWFTEAVANKIASVTTTGVFAEYPIPTADSLPRDIVVDGDGNFWFTETDGNKVGRFGVPPPLSLCTATPLAGCRKPLSAGKSSLMLRDRTPDSRDLLAWKWLKGDATAVSDFGNPVSTTGYGLCLYDETAGVPTLVQSIVIHPSGTCSNQPCWKPRTHGFKYANKAGTPNGVVSIFLNDGGPGAAHISVKATGIHVALPPLPLQQDPKVTLQLRNDLGECWDADYSTAQRNEAGDFKAKSD